MNKYLKIINERYPDSKYKNWYIKLCERSLSRSNIDEYIEKHHILPKCICNEEYQKVDRINIVSLTLREHYIAHLLLWKITNERKLAYAIKCFNDMRDVKVNSKIYEKLKKENSLFLSHVVKERLQRDGHPRQGVTLSDETKEKISKSLTGFKMAEETKKKISDAAPRRIEKYGAPNTNKKWSDEYKAKMSESCKKVKKTEEWNKKNSESNMGRVHIANVVTKERKRPRKEDAEKLLNEPNSNWIKLATSKPIPDKVD